MMLKQEWQKGKDESKHKKENHQESSLEPLVGNNIRSQVSLIKPYLLDIQFPNSSVQYLRD